MGMKERGGGGWEGCEGRMGGKGGFHGGGVM